LQISGDGEEESGFLIGIIKRSFGLATRKGTVYGYE
jgi:hypothetical protein